MGERAGGRHPEIRHPEIRHPEVRHPEVRHPEIRHLEERRGTERRKRRSLVFPERRTGFDRRAMDRGSGGIVAAYGRRPGIVAAVVGAILVLNLADLLLTRRALGAGAVELNPVMAELFAAGPLAAAAFKLTVGALVAWAIWALRRYRRILELSLGITAAYSLLVVYHLVSFAAAG